MTSPSITATETAQALAIAAETDPYEWVITTATAKAWQLMLAEAAVTADELHAAVVIFYTAAEQAGRRITPPDVVRIAGEIRREEAGERLDRERRLKHAPYPNGITWADVREGRAEVPTGFDPPPDPTVRDRTDDLRKLISGAFPDVPAVDVDGAVPGPRPLREDPERLHALLERHRVAPDGHERWSPIGDHGMRRTQAHWTPELAEARHAAARELARQRVAGSDSSYARHVRERNTSQESDD